MQPRIALCSVCHAQMPPGQPLCRNCGTILCPHCRVPLPQRSRFCPRCGFLCIPEEPRTAVQPMTPTVTVRPQSIPTPRIPGTSSHLRPQASMRQQSAVPPGRQNQHNCPECGASVDPASGRCSGCGLLYGNKHRVMEQHVPRPTPASPLPIPRPQNAPSYPSQANYNIKFQYNYPAPIATPVPTFEPSVNYNPPGIMPYSRIQPLVPRPVPVAASTMPVPVGIPVPSKQYKPVSPTSREPGASSSAGRAFARVTATFVVLIMCFFIGSGIYYAFGQNTANQNTISHRKELSRSYIPATSTPILIPSISTSSVTETGAIMTLKTDAPATSQITIYDPSGAVAWTEASQAPVTNYSVTVSGLKPDTTYRYTVISRDAKGNEVTSEGTLRTAARADTTPPVISGVNVSGITETSAIITWITNEPATCQVEYGTTETYGLMATGNSSLSTTHSVILGRLNPDTTYYFKIISKDARGNISVLTSNQTFKTLPIIPVGCQIGNRAPDFRLKNLAGQDVTLGSFRGKIVMLNFWATWCEPCIREMPLLQEVSEKWPRDRLVILAVHVKDRAESAQPWINDKSYTFPILLDLAGDAKSLYNVTEIPRTFFINADGIIKEIKYGPFRSQAEIENILNSL